MGCTQTQESGEIDSISGWESGKAPLQNILAGRFSWTFLENIMALTFDAHWPTIQMPAPATLCFRASLGPRACSASCGSNGKLTPNQCLTRVGYYDSLASQSSSSRIKPKLQTMVTCLVIHYFFALFPLLCCFLRAPPGKLTCLLIFVWRLRGTQIKL